MEMCDQRSQQCSFGEHEVFGHGVFKDYWYFSSVVKTDLNLFREHAIFFSFLSIHICLMDMIKYCLRSSITVIHQCNSEVIEPQFYIVKLRFTGVYIGFRIFALKHRLWVLVIITHCDGSQ